MRKLSTSIKTKSLLDFNSILHREVSTVDGCLAPLERWSLRSQSASVNRYEVDIIDESCTCPDWQQRSPEGGCKHLRRVDHEIKRGRVPRPDGRLPSP